jgi:hypothetical protein
VGKERSRLLAGRAKFIGGLAMNNTASSNADQSNGLAARTQGGTSESRIRFDAGHSIATPDPPHQYTLHYLIILVKKKADQTNVSPEKQ